MPQKRKGLPMKKYSTYVGMDVHARSITCQSYIAETGETASRTFGGCPTADDIASWLEDFPKPAYCAYESGCTAFELCRGLRRLGVGCDVIAVTTLAKSGKHRAQKCDRLDACVILAAIANPMSDHTVAEAAGKPRWKPYVDAISALKGVEPRGAFLAAAEFGDFSRFASGRKVSCWLGTVPKNNSSGESERHGGITKAGNSRLRRTLVEGNGLRACKARMAVVSEQACWIWAIGLAVQAEQEAAS